VELFVQAHLMLVQTETTG